METPILLGVEGQAQEIVEGYEAGVSFEPENKADFLEKLGFFKNDKVMYHQTSRNGANLAKAYDRKKLARIMLSTLESVSKFPGKAIEVDVDAMLSPKVHHQAAAADKEVPVTNNSDHEREAKSVDKLSAWSVNSLDRRQRQWQEAGELRIKNYELRIFNLNTSTSQLFNLQLFGFRTERVFW